MSFITRSARVAAVVVMGAAGIFVSASPAHAVSSEIFVDPSTIQFRPRPVVTGPCALRTAGSRCVTHPNSFITNFGPNTIKFVDQTLTMPGVKFIKNTCLSATLAPGQQCIVKLYIDAATLAPGTRYSGSYVLYAQDQVTRALLSARIDMSVTTAR